MINIHVGEEGMGAHSQALQLAQGPSPAGHSAEAALEIRKFPQL